MIVVKRHVPSVVSHVLLAPNGTEGAPSYSFAGDTDSGFYYRSTNQLALSISGTGRFGFLAAGGTVGIIRCVGESSGIEMSDGIAGAGVVRVVRDSANLVCDPGAGDLKINKALVALGATTSATIGNIGSSGPATAAQNSWLQLVDDGDATFWVPAWK
jgi:hypothetical protein